MLHYIIGVLPSELWLSLNITVFPFNASEQSELAGKINLLKRTSHIKLGLG